MKGHALSSSIAALLLCTGVVAACGGTPHLGGTTASPTAAPGQPAGMPILYAWDGVGARMLMSGLFQVTTAKPGYQTDWTTWAFAGTKWLAAPPAQTLPSIKGAEALLVYDSDRQRDVLIVSGAPVGGPPSLTTAGVWEWDGHSWQHRATVHELPPVLSQFTSAAYGPDLHAVVLVDTGVMPGTGHDITYLYDGVDWRQTPTAHWPVSAGYMSYDPAHHAVVMLDSQYATWRFDGTDWSQIALQSDVTPRLASGMGRQAPAVAFDQARDRWVVFAGFDGSNWFADTWTGDGAAWKQESPATSPIARVGYPGRSIMAWDSLHQVALLFGGSVQQTMALGDTWAWDGQGWKQLAGPSYPPIPSPSLPPSAPPASAPRVTTPPPLIPPSSNLLFAVTESPAQSQPDTVAIVGMDGYAKTKAKLQPRLPAQVPDVAIPLQSVAQVAGSTVYYIDGAGVVRKLQVGSAPQTVATFTQPSSQYETWFAVSADGSQLMAGVLTLPALGPIVSPAPWPTLVGPWKFDLESAHAGGSATVLQHQESTAEPDAPGATWKPIFPVGWTSGAVGMVPISVGTQNIWYGGPLMLLDSAGKPIQQLGGGDCYADVITPAGLIACISAQGALSVRNSAGEILWTSQIQIFSAQQLYLSPDGRGVADDRQIETRSAGLIQTSGIQIEGWLDNNNVVARIGNGDLGWLSLGDPGTIHDFGFKGDFVGTLAGG